MRSREVLDNMHGSAAERTLPPGTNGQRGVRGRSNCWLIGRLEQSKTEWKKLRSPSVSEKSEVTDAHKTARQQVQQEAAQELFDGQGHEPFLVAMSGVAPAEGDVAVGKSNQPAVGNGDAMSVSAEIAQHMFWPAEGWFGVDDPVFAEKRTQPGREELRMGERSEFSGQV